MTLVSPLRYRVLVGQHVNAAFLQKHHAVDHYKRCIDDLSDLPNADVSLVSLDDTGAMVVCAEYKKCVSSSS